MKEKKINILIILGCLLLISLTVSVAYFMTKIEGEGKEISVSSKELKVIFTQNNTISSSNIEPGWSNTISFTVKNEQDASYKYNIAIKDLVNTFVTNGYLVYKISSNDGGYNMSEYKVIPKSSSATDKVLAYSVEIESNTTHSYSIEFKYINSSEDQSSDMGKTLSGTMMIEEGTINIRGDYEEGTLGWQLLDDNQTRSARTSFSAVFTNTTTGTIYTATEKNVHNTSDTTVYYYAGNTTNNWVKFGKYETDNIVYRGYYSATSSNDFEEYSSLNECTSASSYNVNCTEYKYASAGDDIYWRIIRTNADGSVRLLYSGISPDTEEGYIGKSVFNSTYKDSMYVGYMYGTSGSLESNRLNVTDSTIKGVIDTWYSNNLTSYTNYLSTTAVYCNDRGLASGSTYSTSSEFYYAGYGRINTNKTPTYDCTESKDAFSGSNSEAKLTYPIALMTADEIAYAGGVWGSNNSSVWYYLNSANGSVTGSTKWWLLSPFVWNGEISLAYSFGVLGSDNPGNLTYGFVGYSIGVRPVISVKSTVTITGGSGEADNPYIIN